MDSPSTTNYFQGTGYLKWTPAGGVERDLGNIVECEITPTVEKLEHKTARVGTSKTDLTIYRNQAATIRLVLDEITAENLALLMMSEVVTNTDATKTIRILSESVLAGALTFTGTNDIGNVITGDFPSVSFGPSGSFSPISSDDWGQVEITGDLLATVYTDGSSDFGTMTVTDAA
ncbi:MAG: hypothetical protein EOS70_23440 [Mesorhizobium sp.]|uniref:hypothetical protein n=1 Tax=Mesorhizobium sp. TaxID=1871066 RepID=UPI000FE888B1|nr:hypothetical protein [Mesorhizobium sp.]RWC29845.1 MAG: hypothetical protein EOS70_23440 [Mesorhizobium sp.]